MNRPVIALDPSLRLPLFLQIARSVVEDVRRGRLRRGDRLPSSRALADLLEVHRNTVLAAYHELELEGWIATRPAGGTFVSTALPDAPPRRFAPSQGARDEVPAQLGFPLGAGPASRGLGQVGPGVLTMYGGLPDVRLVPVAALARAYRRALRLHGRAVLGYGDPRGHARLRAALAAMVSAVRGLVAGAESVLVTRGSQMALDLAARALIAPGDVVAVEALGYRPAWEALRRAGARLVPVPVDADGVRVDALAALEARRPVRAIYVTPHHQFPTTVTMAAGRRLALLELARERRIAVLEDDYDHEFHYEGRPVLPLASADRAGVVVYIGTLSKILAPGLRIGFLVGPTPLVERLAALRLLVDRQGDQATECAVAELIEDGEVQRHAHRARRAYLARRAALVEALLGQLGRELAFRVPAGGMALWARVADGIDADAWAERALAGGVAVQTARHFAFDGRARPYFRIGFAALAEEELREGVRRLARGLPVSGRR